MYRNCVEKVHEYYNEPNCGASGKALESAIATIIGVYQGVASGKSLLQAFLGVQPHETSDHGHYDVAGKKGVYIEAKSGGGSLQQCVSAFEAKTKADTGDIQILHATFVAYVPRYDLTNVLDVVVMPTRRFVNCLDRARMARYKKKPDGDYISVQTIINDKYPTVYDEKYHFHGKKAWLFWKDLEENGEKLNTFLARMFGFEIPAELFEGL